VLLFFFLCIVGQLREGLLKIPGELGVMCVALRRFWSGEQPLGGESVAQERRGDITQLRGALESRLSPTGMARILCERQECQLISTLKLFDHHKILRSTTNWLFRCKSQR